jgi:hypothetical protein
MMRRALSSSVSARLLWLVAAAVTASALDSGDARAEDASLPPKMQVELLAKVAGYDRTLPGVTEGLVRIIVVTRKDSAESSSAATHVVGALSNISRIAGVPHQESITEFSDAATLAAACKAQATSILIFTPGLGDSVDGIAKALAGVPVLTASIVPADVPRGAILGFDLVESKPRLLVNLAESRAQGVRLSVDVLKVAKVIP